LGLLIIEDTRLRHASVGHWSRYGSKRTTSIAGQSSIHVVLADEANAGRLWPLVANFLRKTHVLPHLKVVELATFDAIAMKVDFPSIRRRNDPMVSFWM
jgi:hypothetical protein